MAHEEENREEQAMAALDWLLGSLDDPAKRREIQAIVLIRAAAKSPGEVVACQEHFGLYQKTRIPAPFASLGSMREDFASVVKRLIEADDFLSPAFSGFSHVDSFPVFRLNLPYALPAWSPKDWVPPTVPKPVKMSTVFDQDDLYF